MEIGPELGGQGGYYKYNLHSFPRRADNFFTLMIQNLAFLIRLKLKVISAKHLACVPPKNDPTFKISTMYTRNLCRPGIQLFSLTYRTFFVKNLVIGRNFQLYKILTAHHHFTKKHEKRLLRRENFRN